MSVWQRRGGEKVCDVTRCCAGKGPLEEGREGTYDVLLEGQIVLRSSGLEAEVVGKLASPSGGELSGI